MIPVPKKAMECCADISFSPETPADTVPVCYDERSEYASEKYQLKINKKKGHEGGKLSYCRHPR
jgi:hypothetical protein